MPKRARTYVLVALASVMLLALWPALLMPNWLYQGIYGWRYPDVRECGDAVVTDHGPRAAYNRVLVEIGEIDLGAEGVYLFSLCELPEERLVFGLALPLPERSEASRDPVANAKASDVGGVIVEISMIDETGQPVLFHSGQLRDQWIWSYGATHSGAVKGVLGYGER